jgi:hypothetical protein
MSDVLAGEMFRIFNTQEEIIVRVRGPLVRWSRNQDAIFHRVADRSISDSSSGKLVDRRFLSVFTILSRRSVRRHNSVAARAVIAVHCVEVASLLP